MILVDIDDTISPTQPDEKFLKLPHEAARAGGWTIKIPTHVLSFLRAREDVVLLSTWGASAYTVAEAFKFSARVAVMEEFTDELGIKGKFQVVQELKPLAWLDDHIKPSMKTWAQEQGVITLRPTGGYIKASQLNKLESELVTAEKYVPTPAEARLHSSADLLREQNERLKTRGW